jgi:RND family efflux transporter MFP subunit
MHCKKRIHIETQDFVRQGSCLAGILGLLFQMVAMPLHASSSYVGVVYPEQDLLLSFGVSGLVAGEVVKPGVRVQSGQTLVSLQTHLQQIELERRHLSWQDDTEKQVVEQRLVVLRDQLNATERLFNQSRSVSLDELNKLRLDVLALEGRLAQITIEKQKAKLEYKMVQEEITTHHLVAPIQGTVIQVRLSVGEWAKQGEPIIRLVDTLSTHIKINVPDNQARRLSIAQKAHVQIEGLAEPKEGEVEFISPIADPASGLVEVKITLDNKNGEIRPGSRASVRF